MNELEKRVYEVMTDHQQQGTAGWDLHGLNLHDVMQKLHHWADLFRLRFKLEIPAVPLRLDRLRWNCLGHFNPEFNDFGLRNEIAIDVGHLVYRLKSDAWWEVLGTLLHEQLHFWQQVNAQPSKPGPGNYHNVQYRSKAEGLGLIVSSRGVNEGYISDGPFLKVLGEEGIEVPLIGNIGRVCSKPRVGSKLKRWTCRCIPPIRLRVGRSKTRVQCLDCGQVFEQDMN